MLSPAARLGVDQAQGHGIHEPCAMSDLISEFVARAVDSLGTL